MSDVSDTPASRPGGRSRSGRRTLLFAASVVVALLAAEAAARLFHWGPPAYTPPRIETPGGVPFLRFGDGFFMYQPNCVFSCAYDPAGDARGYFGATGRIVYTINAYGMRGPAVTIEKAPNTLRVVCLGDSFTFGEGVYYPDTYPAQLENRLSTAYPARRVEVLNAGVQAYGTREEVRFFLTRCAGFHPDIVTLGFFLNDATPIAETIRDHHAITRSADLSRLGRLSRLWAVLERRRHASRIQEDYFRTTRRSFDSTTWNDCRDLLKGMQLVSKEYHFRFLVVIFPMLWQLDDTYPFTDLHARIVGACRAAGCEVLDLLDTYRGRRAETLWVHPTDQHPNDLAHRLAAEQIAARLTAGRADRADGS